MELNERYEPDFERECIFVRKVYNECSITDCPTQRIPIPRSFPPAISIVDCEITNVTTEGTIVGPGELTVTVNYVINVEYDHAGHPHFVQQTATFRRRRIFLEGILPNVGMEVVILPLLRCINCRIIEGGFVIECDIGIFIVVKGVALVQLEVLGRFCPEPPPCEAVQPIGCEEWFELAESGAFWPPYPPQPQRPHR